jgi:hypothetical protein
MQILPPFEDLSELEAELADVVIPPTGLLDEEVELLQAFPEDEFPGAALPPVEFAAQGDQFLQALVLRLCEIVQKPQGRFVISYISGQPGSRRPPRIQ